MKIRHIIWKRHKFNYGQVCELCGYHGRHQAGRKIHERKCDALRKADKINLAR